MKTDCLCAIDFEIGDDRETEFVPGTPVVEKMIADYEKLENKPQINGREIIGNQSVAYYLQDGLIIDGGSSEGAI